MSPAGLDAETRAGILAHMNADHQAALRHYLRCETGIVVGEDEPLEMTQIDERGFVVRRGGKDYRIAFEAPVHSAAEARQALVGMARKAC
ncbi:MAG: DUF2470 domain-containing protein [Gammaproteobacteria bacterium]|jgi:putative heme iron utilization protein